MRLADLPARLHEFDIVVSCTASTLPIIGLGAVERALKARKHRPMFMVDLAVPRDIEPEVKALEDVYLYTVDDLATWCRQGQANRQAAVAQAEAIIDAGVQSFMHWMDQRGTVPLIQQLNAQADEWRAAELARARKLLAKGEDVDAVLEACRAASRRRCCTAPWPSCMPATPHRASDAADHLAPVPAQRALATLSRGPPFTGAPVRPVFLHASGRCIAASPSFSALFPLKPFLRQQLERYGPPAASSTSCSSREGHERHGATALLSREHAEVTQVAGRYERYKQREADSPARGTCSTTPTWPRWRAKKSPAPKPS
jgi:hypothetical protein